MAQISRPFQIVLVVCALFVALWFIALRGHSSSTSTSGSSAASSSVTTTSTPTSTGSSTIYHGSAPGVEGLTRAIAKAHGAVATSQQANSRLEGKAADASSAASASAAAATAPVVATPATPASTPTTPAPGTSSTTAKPGAIHAAATPSTSAADDAQSKAAEAKSGPARTPARQALVERALKEGKVAVILFWNPKGADDVSDQIELRVLEAVHHLIPGLARRVPALRSELKRSGLELEKKFAAFEARANQVTSFGSITRGVQVYGTPTILVVNPHGQEITITGLTDAYAIEQAIDEARHL